MKKTMDFPNKSFPYQLHKPCQKRELFLSYGSHENIDIDCVENKTFFPQKVPEGFVKKGNFLKAKRPALPLFKDPEPVDYPLIDRVTDPLTVERKDIIHLIQSIKYLKGIVNTKDHTIAVNYENYKGFHKLKETIDNLKGDEDLTELKLHKILPPQWQSLIPLFEKHKTTSEVKKVNSKYTDGCMSYLPSTLPESAGCLVSVFGDCHKIITNLKYADQENVVVDSSSYEVTNEQVHGLTSCNNRGKGYILTRHTDKCKLFCLSDNTDLDLLNTLDIEDGEPTSVCLSPYIPGESLIATNKGTVYLWSLDSNREVMKEKNTRFYCRDQWRQAVFSSHPRQIVLADCTTVEMFDIRTNISSRNGTDLFALPSKFLHIDERIRIVKQHSPFMYVIATDNSLVVTDERFPGHPVLQWQHLLKSPPQYMSVLSDVWRDKHSLISIASQRPMESYCYMFQGGNQKPLQGIGAPWKLARIDDYTKWEEICNGTDVIAVEDKYNKDSLLGLQCVPYNDGFIAYQLDSHFDIYYQVFQSSNDKGDKTFAAGPGINSLIPDDITKEKGKHWVGVINNCWKNKDAQILKRVPVKDFTSYYEDIVIEKQSHMSCSLCNDKDDREDNVYTNTQAEDREDHICHCCRNSLSNGKTISENVSKDTVCSMSSSVVPSLPVVSSLSTDILSQIITRLWNEEDVYDLLPQRDDEVRKMLEKRKEEKKKKPEKIKAKIHKGLRPAVAARIKNDKARVIEEKAGLVYDSEMEDETSDNINLKNSSLENRDLNSEKIATVLNEQDKNEFTQRKQNSRSQPNDNVVGIVTPQKTSCSVERSTQSSLDRTSPTFVTKDAVLNDLNSKRRRHSSASSLSSIDSRSSSIPGFMRTPTQRQKSRVTRQKSQETDLSSVDLTDEQFSSQGFMKSVQMFTNDKNVSQENDKVNIVTPTRLDNSSPGAGTEKGDLVNSSTTFVTKDAVLKDLNSKRRRNSSASSLSSFKTRSSIGSSRSASLPGFMRTPTRQYTSPSKRHRDSETDLSCVDPMDEQFLSQESLQSVQMFTNIKTAFSEKSDKNLSNRQAKRMKVDSSLECQKQLFKSPQVRSNRKVNLKKKFVTGF